MLIGGAILCLVWNPQIPATEAPRHVERATFILLSGYVQLMIIGAIHFAARRLFMALQQGGR